MGVKDKVTIKYLRQSDVFADAFNYFIYHGEQVIAPDSLAELDTREIDVPYGGIDGNEQPVQRTRDIIKSVVAMRDKRTAYLLLAIESQADIHYAMPVKNMVSDALQYAKQVEKATASHKGSGDYKGAAGAEYLSGFMKSDRLLPVVTLTIYFDSKAWDGPLSIHEMFENQDSRVFELVPDYRINLLAPFAMEKKDFEKFQTTLKEILTFIKYADDKERLGKIVEEDEVFHHLGRTEVDVLNACVGAKITVKEDEEETNVCLAIEQMKEEAAEKAVKKAMESAEKAAKKAAKAAKEEAEKATKAAVVKERVKTLADSVKNLTESTGWTKEQAMDNMKIADDEQKILLKLLA